MSISGKPLSELVGVAVKGLIAPDPGEAADVAGRASQICDQLTSHIARILGETGVRTMLKRSLVLASAQHPWLAASVADLASLATTRSCSSALQPVLQQQAPDAATDGFIAVISAFVGLLERLIGERLVHRLLHEVWPASFPHVREETT